MTASLHALATGRDAGLYYVNDPNRESRPKSRDEYYVRDGGGTWWSTGGTIVRHGAEIDKETFRDLCAGIDPTTGKPLIRGSGPKHRAGWDVTFSAPKTLSVLWMSSLFADRQFIRFRQPSEGTKAREIKKLLANGRLKILKMLKTDAEAAVLEIDPDLQDLLDKARGSKSDWISPEAIKAELLGRCYNALMLLPPARRPKIWKDLINGALDGLNTKLLAFFPGPLDGFLPFSSPIQAEGALEEIRTLLKGRSSFKRAPGIILLAYQLTRWAP
jgi:TrwC relaxase